MYLDFSKCFNTVPHSKLLFKLSSYGISDMAFKWIENLLLGRDMSVRVNNHVVKLESPQV